MSQDDYFYLYGCTVFGFFGGFMFHCNWLTDTFYKNKVSDFKLDLKSSFTRFAFSLLPAFSGAVYGLLIWFWYSSELMTGEIAFNKVGVIAFVFGLSGTATMKLLQNLALKKT